MITRELDALSKKATEAGSSTAAGVKKIGQEADAMTAKTQAATREVAQLGQASVYASRALIGPLGLAAAFLAVGKSLEGFATSRVQLRNFATDSGFATTEVRNLRQAMARMALSTEDADRVIG